MDLPWLGKELWCPVGFTAREFQGEALQVLEFASGFSLELSPGLAKLSRCRNNTLFCQNSRVFIPFLEGMLELELLGLSSL